MPHCHTFQFHGSFCSSHSWIVERSSWGDYRVGALKVWAKLHYLCKRTVHLFVSLFIFLIISSSFFFFFFFFKPLNGRSSVYGTKPLTRATAEVSYTEQCPKDEEKWCKNDTDKAFVLYKYRREGGSARERIFIKKKKIKIGRKRFYSQVNDKER